MYYEDMGKNSDSYGYSPIPFTIQNEDGTTSITRHYRVNSKGEKVGVLPKDVPQKALDREADGNTEAPAAE